MTAQEVVGDRAAREPPPRLVDPRTLMAAAPRAWRVLRILRRHKVLRAIRGRDHWPAPESVRAALEELGVVYLKFGQVAALRRDILPSAYVAELETLHDALPPLPLASVQEIVESELAGPIEVRFSSFDPHPIAAATIAQVHGAVTSDGRRVVVKVRRPGLQRLIAEDAAVLTYLATVAEAVHPRLRALGLVRMVHEFRATLVRETDLLLEADTIRRFRGALKDSPGVSIPDVVSDYTTAAVLTMEHSPGERIDRYAETHPGEARALADRLATIIVHQVFETGLFHADPHPGNVFVLPDGRICLHDFGMIGALAAETSEALLAALEAFVTADGRGLAAAYMELGLVGGDVDRSALERDLTSLVREIHARPLEHISIGRTLESLLRIGSEHQVRNPQELLLLARAFIISESLMHRLDPALSVLDVFRAELVRVRAHRYAPARVAERAVTILREIEQLAERLPERVDRALRRAADGDLGSVHVPALEAAGRRASRDLERLTGALASAALVVGGALLVGVGGLHRIVGDVLLAVGFMGTLASAFGALWERRR
ncbi:MAG: ABC1 kinase family protein [Gemmatimonadales bacterium]